MTTNPLIAAVAAALIATPLAADSQEAGGTTVQTTKQATAPTATGRVDVNDVSYYYEIHGEGEPLLLLHGGLGSIDMFGPILPFLTADRRVIAVDLKGHGRTTLGSGPIRMPALADDVAAILEHLGESQVDVLGYSMGGEVGLRLAIQHPETVRRLATVSTGFDQNGFYPEMLPQQAAVGAAMADMMKETPMYQSYAAVAPNLDDFPRLLDAMGDWMRQPYNWADEVKTLKMPVMLVYGDSDMVRLDHAVEFYQLLGGGLKDAGWQRENMAQNRLAILPDLTHYDIFGSPQLAHTVLPFLNGVSGAKSWAEQVTQSH
jgi:pimeloyl-ACP methyl ester carboxylesterase